jgi:hypothetical protein
MAVFVGRSSHLCHNFLVKDLDPLLLSGRMLEERKEDRGTEEPTGPQTGASGFPWP